MSDIAQEFSTMNSPTAPSPDSQGVLYDGWIYPNAPGALAALQDGRQIYAVKAEFLHVNDDGSLQQIDQSAANPNGYSPANVALMNAHSTEQYITVSGDEAGTTLAMQHPEETINTMVDLANKIGFGIELDWEEFGQWTPAYYQSFKTFLGELGSRLHANGHRLMIDGPPIYDSNSQSWYRWKYEELTPLVDNIVMMIYDNQYDTGAGNPIAPTDWSIACLRWLHEKAGNKAIAGIASYGYTANMDTGHINVTNSDFVLRRLLNLAIAPAARVSDGELTMTVGNTFYDYSDQQTMDTRLKLVQQSGIERLSVWSIGGNPWF